MRFPLLPLAALVLGAAPLFLCAQSRPAAAPAPAPVVNWELPEAYLKDNGLRGEVVLNAFWKVRSSDGSGAETVEPVPSSASAKTPRDFTREFSVPAAWRSRRVVLEVGNFGSDGEVLLDGEKLGSLTKGDRWVELPLPDAARSASRLTLTLRATGVVDDVILRSYPAGPGSVDDSYLTTSVRRKEVKIALSGRAPAGAAVRPLVAIFPDPAQTAGQPLFTLAPEAPVVADAKGKWSATLVRPWTDARLWSHWDPKLYAYRVELQTADGRAVDRQLPRTFGFREVWTEGPVVMLNGFPLHFTADTWTGLGHRNGNSNTAQLEASIDLLKAAGIHAGHRLESPNTFAAADRKGIITVAYIFGLDFPGRTGPIVTPDMAGDAGGDHDAADNADAARYAWSQERMRKTVRKYREHPSVFAWMIRGPWHRGTLDSTQQGNIEDPWEFWPTNKDERGRRAYEIASKSLEFARTLDQQRPFNLQNQPGSEIELATRYLCIDLDRHERAAFFRAWSRRGDGRVLWPSEYDLAPFHGHQFLRKSPHQLPQGQAFPAIHVENAAREFGDSVYLDEPEERIRLWNRWRDEGHRSSPVYQRFLTDNFTDVLLGWRTAGLSGFAHWVLREGFDFSKTKKTIEDRVGVPRLAADARRPGYAATVGPADQPTGFPIPGVDDALEGGRQYLRNLAPLLAYIGGPGGNVWERRHLYTVGDTIEKSVVVLNDRFTPAKLRGKWELVDASGRAVAGAALDFEVPAASRNLEAVKLRLSAPAVRERADFTMRLKLEADAPGTLDHEFALTVFPAALPPAGSPNFRGTTWYLEADGRFAQDAAYQAYSRGAQKLAPGSARRPASGDVVIVPRGFLQEPAGLAALKAIDFDKLVESGVRVLVFEQSAENILGLQTENVRPRRVFSAAPGHPALEGLSASDLTFWNGSPDLDPETTSHPRGYKFFPARLWKVTNEHAVATRTLLRPQTGAARALLVSGFDLRETPLLEVARGQGRMIFCQLDVSNRYGSDPVATRIVHNLVRYLQEAPAADPARSAIARVPAGSPEITVRSETFRVGRPEGAMSWGITRAELFYRDSIYVDNWITKTRPEGKVPVFAKGEADKMPVVYRYNSAAKRVELAYDEGDFPSGWAKTKVAFLRTALLINQGGSSLEGPSLARHGDAKTLYPREWLEGFVNPYTAACW